MSRLVKFSHHPDTVEVQIHYSGQLVRFKWVPRKTIQTLETMLQSYGRSEWNPLAEITNNLYRNAFSNGRYMLKLRRYQNKLSQRQLAVYIGVKQSNLSMMEQGKRVIGTKVAKRLGKFFNCTYKDFL